jgi:NAD-dependent DNA ligase
MGALQMKRDDASRRAEISGADVSGTVSASTDILVCGSGVGAKKTDDAEEGRRGVD